MFPITPKMREGCLAFVSQSFLGMLWAWRYCAYKTDLMFSGAEGTNILMTPSWIVDSIACLVVLAVLPFAMRKIGRRAWRAIIASGAAAMAIGTVVTGAFTMLGSVPLIRLGGLLTGIGSGVLYTACGTRYVDVDVDRLETLIPLQMIWVLGGALVAPLFSHGILGAVFVALFPLACGLLLLRDDKPIPSAHVHPEVRGMAAPSRSQVAVLLVCLVLFHLATGTSMMSPAALELTEVLGPKTAFYRMVFFVVCAAMLAIVLTAIRMSRRYTLISVLRRCVPFLIIAVVLTTASPDQAVDITCSLVIAFIMAFVPITFHIWALRLGKYGMMAPHVAFNLFTWVNICSIVCGNVISAHLTFTDVGVASGSLAVISLVSAALLLAILPEREHAEVEDHPVGAGIGDAIDLPSTTLASCTAGPSGITGTTGSALNTASDLFPAVTAPAPAANSRLQTLARDHGLTQRETEICILLGQGRSRPYIREKLFISKNTVDTHVAHIYQKLGIHSNQELIDLLQDSEPR